MDGERKSVSKMTVWPTAQAILLAIKMMVEQAGAFQAGSIGFDGRGVDRIRLPRAGPLWDALRSADGPPAWWKPPSPGLACC